MTYMSKNECVCKEVPEKDKPYYLAVISSFITGMCIWIGAVGAAFHNTAMVEFSLESLKFTFPLTTMAWAFYFKVKK